MGFRAWGIEFRACSSQFKVEGSAARGSALLFRVALRPSFPDIRTPPPAGVHSTLRGRTCARVEELRFRV